MNDVKYIGLDVHQTTISAAVLDSTGKLVMECVLETKAVTILQFNNQRNNPIHDKPNPLLTPARPSPTSCH
jgi:hypothetical protein